MLCKANQFPRLGNLGFNVRVNAVDKPKRLLQASVVVFVVGIQGVGVDCGPAFAVGDLLDRGGHFPSAFACRIKPGPRAFNIGGKGDELVQDAVYVRVEVLPVPCHLVKKAFEQLAILP